MQLRTLTTPLEKPKPKTELNLIFGHITKLELTVNCMRDLKTD